MHLAPATIYYVVHRIMPTKNSFLLAQKQFTTFITPEDHAL